MASPIDTFAPESPNLKTCETYELSLNFGENKRKNSRPNDSNQATPMHEVKVINFNNNYYEETKSPFIESWTVRQAFIRNVYFVISFQNLFSFLLATFVAES